MAVITVDPGGGGDHTTMAAAIAAATSADSIRIINNDLTENNVALNKDILGIDADIPTRIWTASGNFRTFRIQSGMTVSGFFLSSMVLKNEAKGRCLQWEDVGVGSSIICTSVKFDHSVSGTGTSIDGVRLNNQTTVDQAVFNRCEFVGDNVAADRGLRINSGASNANVVRVQNCIFRDWTEFAISVVASTTNNVINIFNCTIENCAIGIQTSSRGTFTNNLMINNTDDVSLAGSSDAADFTFCAFEEQGSPFGSNNIFSIVSTDEVVDEVNHDFRLKSGAQSRDAGTTITGVDDDFDGTSRPQGSAFDIGAFEFIAAAPNNNVLTAGVVQKMLVAGVIQKVKGT